MQNVIKLKTSTDHVISWCWAMLSFVFFECGVKVIPSAVVDEEASDVRLGLRTDHLRYDLEVLAKRSYT